MTVLDASAVIAWLKEEPGSDHVEAALDSGHAVISAVNLAEVLSRFRDAGHEPAQVMGDLALSGLKTLGYGPQHAAQTALLRDDTRSLGLSLGDRACLALGLERDAPVLTADRAWAALTLPLTITLIR